MNNQDLEIKVTIQVQKNVHEVFEAIADPAKMTHYFIAKSTGRMDTGRELLWKFPEFEIQVPVRVSNVEEDKYISFYWDGTNGEELLVAITLTPDDNNGTLVTITEICTSNNEATIKWAKGNTEGWANFAACLKAYAEYGINLRKGAFDFLKKPKENAANMN